MTKECGMLGFFFWGGGQAILILHSKKEPFSLIRNTRQYSNSLTWLSPCCVLARPPELSTGYSLKSYRSTHDTIIEDPIRTFKKSSFFEPYPVDLRDGGTPVPLSASQLEVSLLNTVSLNLSKAWRWDLAWKCLCQPFPTLLSSLWVGHQVSSSLRAMLAEEFWSLSIQTHLEGIRLEEVV